MKKRPKWRARWDTQSPKAIEARESAKADAAKLQAELDQQVARMLDELGQSTGKLTDLAK